MRCFATNRIGSFSGAVLCFVFIVLPLVASCSHSRGFDLQERYVQSAKLQSGHAVRIDAENASSLYTMTISYPTDSYTGSSYGKFTLKGVGNTRKTCYSELPSAKTAPADQSDWVDLVCLNYGSGGDSRTSGLFWFADETNKIKYYCTESAKNGIFGELEPEYWDEWRGYISEGVFKDDVLGTERKVFHLDKYDKSGTGYFHVVFSDFGEGSMISMEDKWLGVAGAYSNSNIRPGRGSNEADIFFVNSRYMEGYSEYYKKDEDGYPEKFRKISAETVISTLVHEYMHYLMDSNILSKAEKEFEEDILPETGTIYDANGNIPSGKYASGIKYLTSNLSGSIFWYEGTANYASYRIIGDSESNAVKDWLGITDRWRPPIDSNDGSAEAGDSYAVYGAGGLYFAYIAEKYGQETESRFHGWRDSASDLTASGNLSFGNINTMTKSILNDSFKNVYRDFLCHCFVSISDSSKMPNADASGFACFSDWGFTKGVLDSAIDECGFAIADASKGYSSGWMPEMSFVINRWDEIPESIELECDGCESYAIWF
ncbi:MAG TPA: hypothetical protein DCO86_04040 [Spirochaetaceae bacterium]|nr:hypothetical protein [Spirochaetaceae bacterium]